MRYQKIGLALVMCLALGGCVSGLPKALVQQGRGDFQGLVADVESQYGSSEKAPPLERALSCYAYYELRQYHKFQVCAKFILAMDDPSFEFYPGMPKTYENASEVKATVHGYLAQMYFEFLQFDKAIAEADKSLELVEQAIEPGRKRYLRITALEAKALSLINLGRGNEVGPLITTIEAQQSNIPADKTQLAKFRQSALAKIYFAQGDYVDARKVLEERVSDVFGNILKQSARVFTDLEDGADTLAISNALPKLYMLDKAMLETGEIDQARAGYDKLLSQPVTKQFGDFYWMALVDRAKIYWMQGERGQAIDKLKLAIDAIEAQRSSIQTEAFKIGFVGDKQKAYGQIVDYLVAEHRNAEAFQYAERAKARALVDMLASKSSFANASSASGHSVAELDELELTLAANDARLDAGSAKRTRGLMMSAKQDVVQSDPALASLVTVDTPQPAELQTRLAPGEVILEYYGAGEHLFAFVVSSRQISVVPIDATGLDAAVSHFRRAILDVNSEAYLADAQSLYRRLVTPVGRQIEGHKLVIVPQGALHYLPFAALHDGSEFFIDRFKYRVLPSASVIELLNTHPAANHSLSLLALGNPDLGDPRYALPGAEQEVENLGKLMPSARIVVHRNATETLLKQYGGLARYVHIASHGQFNPQHPLASRLLLAPDKDNDGNLTVAELYDLKLDADMVVLSACQTGLGDVESGDDVIGLTRGFLYAGASNIIASLWVVDDKATSLLMTDLYKQLDTTDKETALRDAQLDVKANYNSHPFYWAAFQLTGKG